MDQKVASALESENQIFAAPSHVGHALARELRFDDFGKLRTGQPRVCDLDDLEGPAHEPRGQARADRLNLGELWHFRSRLGEHRRVEAAPAVELRSLVPADWPEIAAIFEEGIRTGTATFETEVPSWEEWDAAHLVEPRFVALLSGDLVGWAALLPASPRPVYSGVAENSVYVSARARGQGVGRRLLEELVAESERIGIWTLQAVMFPENDASVALHRACGFRMVGVRKRLAKLDGVWRDIVLLERRSDLVV